MAPVTEFAAHRTTLFGHAATAHPGPWPAKVVTNLTATFVAGS